MAATHHFFHLGVYYVRVICMNSRGTSVCVSSSKCLVFGQLQQDFFHLVFIRFQKSTFIHLPLKHKNLFLLSLLQTSALKKRLVVEKLTQRTCLWNTFRKQRRVQCTHYLQCGVFNFVMKNKWTKTVFLFLYRDASFGTCSYNLSLMDVLNGLYKVQEQFNLSLILVLAMRV